MSRSRGVAIGLVAILFISACTQSDNVAEDGRDTDAGPVVTDRTFETFEGEQISLPDFAGELLVVNFWASWCPPCVAEMPDFERVHIARQDEVKFIGINTQDRMEQAKSMVEQTGVTYVLGWDLDGELFRDFEVVAMPSTFFVNTAGVIVHRHAGILSQAQLEGLIDEHLMKATDRS